MVFQPLSDLIRVIVASSLRAAAEHGKQAGCESTYKIHFNDYWVWGHSWVSLTNNESLKNEAKGRVRPWKQRTRVDCQVP